MNFLEGWREMTNILEEGIDLNEIVNKAVHSQIEELKSEIELYKDKYQDIYAKNKEMEKKISHLKDSDFLFEQIKTEFMKIKKGESDSGGRYDSKQKNQFIYIKNILSNIFNVEMEQNGWLCSRGDGQLCVHLAVNYYTKNDLIINLLKILKPDCSKDITFIRNFVMPYDYSKDAVFKYVKSPQHNTNGCTFGISQYWLDSGAGINNMPHDLIMKNSYILDDGVFKELLVTIKQQKPNWYYLFALPKYNQNIEEKHIVRLGECLIGMSEKQLDITEIKSFVASNLIKFNKKTLEYLSRFITSDNHYRYLHFEKMPKTYQEKFLLDMDFVSVLEQLIKCDTWTENEKKVFLAGYIKKHC
jgi:hypothetical protein